MKRIFTFLLFSLVALSLNAQTDTTLGLKAPKKYTKNIKKLTHHLCADLVDEQAKVNAIYNWITHNIAYDVKAMLQGSLKNEDAAKVLKRKKAVCDGYSQLFTAMCREAGVASVVVSGYAKDWMFDNGDKLYIPRHAWNAVFIKGEWHLVDVTWGAGVVGQYPGKMQQKMNKIKKQPFDYSGKLRFKYKYRPEYFMQDPATFRNKHLPADPIWQFCDSAMPLQVFEAGDKAIADFNAAYGKPDRESKELLRYNELDDREMILDAADRMHAFNPRFYVALAAKAESEAVKDLVDAAEKGNDDWDSLHKSVENDLKASEGFLKDQKKAMASQYSELGRKNKSKNAAAKQYISKLHSANRRMLTKCDNRISGARKKADALGSKDREVHNKLKTARIDRFNTIEPKPNPDPAGHPGLKLIEDSLLARDQRIAAMQNGEEALKESIEQAKNQRSNLLDSLADIVYKADSALIKETISRINMNDGNDDEVIQWAELVKEYRLEKTDSLQKYFLAANDTVHNRYEALRKLTAARRDITLKNLKDLEQYKRRAGGNDVTGTYTQRREQCITASNDILQTIAQHRAFLKQNQELYGKLKKLYQHQDKLADYMERAETHRQALEEQTISKKEAFDKKEYEHQQATIKRTGKKAAQFVKKKA